MVARFVEWAWRPESFHGSNQTACESAKVKNPIYQPQSHVLGSPKNFEWIRLSKPP